MLHILNITYLVQFWNIYCMFMMRTHRVYVTLFVQCLHKRNMYTYMQLMCSLNIRCVFIFLRPKDSGIWTNSCQLLKSYHIVLHVICLIDLQKYLQCCCTTYSNQDCKVGFSMLKNPPVPIFGAVRVTSCISQRIKIFAWWQT